MMNSVLLSVTK